MPRSGNWSHWYANYKEREGSIHISNLMLVVNGEATKTGKKVDDKGNLIRYSKKSGEVIK